MSAGPSLDDIRFRIKELVADLKGDGLRPEDIGDHEALFDADWQASARVAIDSLEALELMIRLSREYNVEPAADDDYSDLSTVDEAARRIHSLLVDRESDVQ
jgi:acyl carrier protein